MLHPSNPQSCDAFWHSDHSFVVALAAKITKSQRGFDVACAGIRSKTSRPLSACRTCLHPLINAVSCCKTAATPAPIRRAFRVMQGPGRIAETERVRAIARRLLLAIAKSHDQRADGKSHGRAFCPLSPSHRPRQEAGATKVLHSWSFFFQRRW